MNEAPTYCALPTVKIDADADAPLLIAPALPI